MAQTYSNLLLHIIFSTKHRQPLINTDLKPRLYAYLTRVINEDFGRVLAINGTNDHVHILIDARTTTAPADMLRVIKSNSSGWVHKTFPEVHDFGWQDGYGIFTVSSSNKERVQVYIRNQEEHHRVRTFMEEFVDFLERHEIEYDPTTIWD